MMIYNSAMIPQYATSRKDNPIKAITNDKITFNIITLISGTI